MRGWRLQNVLRKVCEATILELSQNYYISWTVERRHSNIAVPLHTCMLNYHHKLHLVDPSERGIRSGLSHAVTIINRLGPFLFASWCLFIESMYWSIWAYFIINRVKNLCPIFRREIISENTLPYKIYILLVMQLMYTVLVIPQSLHHSVLWHAPAENKDSLQLYSKFVLVLSSWRTSILYQYKCAPITLLWWLT